MNHIAVALPGLRASRVVAAPSSSQMRSLGWTHPGRPPPNFLGEHAEAGDEDHEQTHAVRDRDGASARIGVTSAAVAGVERGGAECHEHEDDAEDVEEPVDLVRHGA
jgi:hypothetical protein